LSFSFNLSLPVVKEGSSKTCRTPADAAGILSDTATLAQEAFTVLTLDTKHHIIDRHLITLGLLDASLVHPREVFRTAIQDGAAAILVSHNHPSGDPTPSAEDIRITRQLVEAGKVLDVQVLDHVVIGRGETPFTSLRETGLVNFGN
jgi:DNA repair protein RadC